MYLSVGQPVPGEVTLCFRVEDAMLLWERIPDGELSDVVTRALIEAEGFVPGNGHVMRTCRDMREEADMRLREERSRRDREAWAKIPLPSAEEREASSKIIRGAMEKLKI